MIVALIFANCFLDFVTRCILLIIVGTFNENHSIVLVRVFTGVINYCNLNGIYRDYMFPFQFDFG